jgi:TRAP-type C4-dicarboxylate transport system permease small subunit
MLAARLFAATTPSSGVTCPDGSDNCSTGLPTVSANSDALQLVLQIVFGIAAAVAVLYIVIGGFRYVISNGDPSGAAKARNTVIYAVVGLAVAVSAEALVTFVLANNT